MCIEWEKEALDPQGMRKKLKFKRISEHFWLKTLRNGIWNLIKFLSCAKLKIFKNKLHFFFNVYLNSEESAKIICSKL